MPRTKTGATDATGKAASKAKRDRPGLSRERVIEAALALADRDGLSALTMRSLAEALGVQAMSLYHHVPHKEALQDALVDVVFAEMGLPDVDAPWREAMIARGHAVRASLNRHPWVLPLLESRRAPGPNNLRHHDAVLGILRRAGFSLQTTAHAYAILDAFLFGFAMQEHSLPFEDDVDAAPVADDIMAAFDPSTYPHLVELATQHVMQPGYRFDASFDVGLAMVLDGIEALHAREARPDAPRDDDA